MDHASLDDLLTRGAARLRRGPLALIFVEDDAALAVSLSHHLRLGFAQILAFLPEGLTPDLPEALREDPRLSLTRLPTRAKGIVPATVNRIAAAAAGQWIFYAYNAEFLFFPFCETRRIAEMLRFHAEERRMAMLCYVVDLYPAARDRAPQGVDLDDAHLDRIGYYAQARPGPDGTPLERQLDFFGGLRWRFEDHIPPDRRRIDRIALFRAQPGLRLGDDHLLNIPEANTFACPWHNNLTAAICSFRAAKALCSNPGSRHALQEFRWHGSEPFRWESRQLMDLGLMEPGQWF